jgi:hypothetical protein
MTRETPEFKAREAQHAAAEAERAEAERRIAAEGPLWVDLGDAARRAWAVKILRDPSAELDPSIAAALEGIEAALAPRAARGRQQKRTIVTPEWIAEFEKAARAYTIRHRARAA